MTGLQVAFDVTRFCFCYSGKLKLVNDLVSGQSGGRISKSEGVILGRKWYKPGHEPLLREIGSSIRQQFRDVRPSGGRLAGASDGGVVPKPASLRPKPRPLGRGTAAPDARSGAQTSGRSGPEKSRSESASLSGLRSQTEPLHPGSPAHLPEPLRTGDGQTAARLVGALPGVALSGRPRLGLE